MKKLVGDFSGDYRVMRVIFSTSDPLATLHALSSTYSYKRFLAYIEYLDAKETMTEDANKKLQAKMKQEQDKQNRGGRG